MAAQATLQFTGDGIIPCWAPEEAKTDAAQLIPGTYAAGTVLGQQATLTAANDVQTLTVTGTPTGGTFVLTFNGDVTAAIAYNAAAADVQAALEALPSIGTGNVVGSSGPLPGTAVVLTFGSALGNRQMPNISIYSASFTGGTAPAASVAHTTPGRTLGASFAAYNDSNSDGTQTAKCVLKFATVVDTFGYHKSGGGEWRNTTTKSAPVYVKGHFKTAELVGIDANGCADLGRIVRGSTAQLTSQVTVLSMT